MQRRDTAVRAVHEPEVLTDWPKTGQQVQHDTNIASQDLEIIASRLRRLQRRLLEESDPRMAGVMVLAGDTERLSKRLKAFM